MRIASMGRARQGEVLVRCDVEDRVGLHLGHDPVHRRAVADISEDRPVVLEQPVPVQIELHGV